MPESFIQVAVDSTGKKIRTWEETIGANTVQNQIIDQRRGPLYLVKQDNIVPAASKCFLGVINASGSGKKMIIHRALAWNNQGTAAITGGEITLRYVRITALSGGTAVSLNKIDTDSAAAPSQVTAATAPTTSTEDTAPAEFFSHKTSTDESVGIANAASNPTLLVNLLANPCNPRIESQQKIGLPEGKGLAIKQGAEAVTAGAISAIIVFELI